MSYNIITYYTPSYEAIFEQHLRKSTQALGLSCIPFSVLDYGSWEANTRLKPQIIWEALHMSDNDVVFVDADAEIQALPVLFDSIPEGFNIGVHFLDWASWYGRARQRPEVLSGTIYVRNCDKGKKIIKAWLDKCEWDTRPDQKILEDVLVGTLAFNLPLEYCYISTLPDGSEPKVKVDKPVIVHYQASREMRRPKGV